MNNPDFARTLYEAWCEAMDEYPPDGRPHISVPYKDLTGPEKLVWIRMAARIGSKFKMEVRK